MNEMEINKEDGKCYVWLRYGTHYINMITSSTNRLKS
jgi:hypothetical protein